MRGFTPDPSTIVLGLMEAYRRGMFPMSDGEHGAIHWFTANPRGILPLREDDGLRVPARLERTIRQRRFELTCDTAFTEVMRGCVPSRKPHDGVWIGHTLIDWYAHLHRAGHAHSLEAWRTDPRTGRRCLVGGIYGVALGAAFFGESMFCLPERRLPDGSRDPIDGTDSSKVCLITLVRHLDACGFELFDTQMTTEHVASFGGYEIGAERFQELLDAAADQPERWRTPVL